MPTTYGTRAAFDILDKRGIQRPVYMNPAVPLGTAHPYRGAVLVHPKTDMALVNREFGFTFHR